MIKRLCRIFVIIAVVLPICSFGDQESQDIPTELREEAGKVFADGKTFFIWSNVKEPIAPSNYPDIQFWIIKFNYRTKEKAGVPFSIYVQLNVKNPKSGKEFPHTNIKKNSDKKIFGKASAALILDKYKLTKGTTIAHIWLQKQSDTKVIKSKKPKPIENISNILSIKLSSGDRSK